MLFYHPAFDGYHAAFRILQIATASGKRSYERDALRILDFYLIFPQLIAEVRLPKAQQSTKRILSSRHENKYHFSGSPRQAFMQMAPLQDMALRLLASKRIIDLGQLIDGVVVRSEHPLPHVLEILIRARNDADSGLIKFLVDELGRIPLRGEDGLKDRSRLMDYRYDQV
jgi:hypothetical protein